MSKNIKCTSGNTRCGGRCIPNEHECKVNKDGIKRIEGVSYHPTADPSLPENSMIPSSFSDLPSFKGSETIETGDSHVVLKNKNGDIGIATQLGENQVQVIIEKYSKSDLKKLGFPPSMLSQLPDKDAGTYTHNAVNGILVKGNQVPKGMTPAEWTSLRRQAAKIDEDAYQEYLPRHRHLQMFDNLDHGTGKLDLAIAIDDRLMLM